jgi:hypothetical protein
MLSFSHRHRQEITKPHCIISPPFTFSGMAAWYGGGCSAWLAALRAMACKLLWLFIAAGGGSTLFAA